VLAKSGYASKVPLCDDLQKTPSRGWTRCFGRHFMRIFQNPSTVYPQSGPTERPHGSAPKMLRGWMLRIGLWLRFLKLGWTDGCSEAPTGCRLRLNDGSVLDWISLEPRCSSLLLSWLLLPGIPYLLQRPVSSSRTLLLLNKPLAG